MTKLLGYMLEDTVSGLSGIAYQYVQFLSGTKQYAIQPRSDGKTMPDAYSVDVDSVRVLSDDAIVNVLPADENVLIGLGDEVEDIVTRATGIAVKRCDFLNGCVYFSVEGRKKDDKEAPSFFTSHTFLRIVTPKKFQRDAEAARQDNLRAAGRVPTTEPPKRETGGPTLRAMRM